MRRSLILVAMVAASATLFAQQPVAIVRNDGGPMPGNRQAGIFGNAKAQAAQYDTLARDYRGRENDLLTPPNGLAVGARAAWTDTGIDVRAGEMLSFAATGEIRMGRNVNAPPEGNPAIRDQRYPVPGMPAGALIGRVGRSAPFAIGDSRRAIQMPVNGRLYLGINNDDGRVAASGAFNVVIRAREVNGPYQGREVGPGGYQGRDYGSYRDRDTYGRPDAYGALLSPGEGLQVPATVAWTDTGINVRAGQMLSFAANGEVRWGRGGGETASPNGNPASMRSTYPLRGAPVGTLVGRVGNSVFPIGANTGAIRMPVSGRLLLSVNDDDRRDNSGAFNVVVRQAS
jgi:hypothetical protein